MGYLDAPLKEHTLLQAIARVNRPHGDEKTYGLVVDYWGVSAKIQDALTIFSTTDVQGALTPSVDELPRLQSRHAAAMRFFQAVADPNNLNACVQVLEPEDVRAAFDLAFRRFSQSMDMLLPDPRALAYHADLRWLGKIRGAARARYHDDRLDLSGCGEKVRKLIADAVVADGDQVLVKEVQLFSPEFEEKVEALRTDEAKASEMEHAIRHEISVHLEENPAFYQSLRERLEAIIEERRQERLDAARQLSLLNSLREELKGEQTRAQDIGLDARGFAIYGLLEEQRPMPVREHAAPYNAANRDLASLLDEEVTPFTELVDWWQKDDLQRQMRSKIKRQLRASGIEAEAVESLDGIVTRKAEWIVQRLRRAESYGPLLSPREFISGESILYLGRHYRLKVHPNEAGDAKLRGGWLHVPAPGGPRQTAQVREAVVRWFRRHAAERLPERVAAWRSKAGVPMPRVIVSNQRKRWGSCDRNGTIRLNWRIIQAPMRLVDYVVVHELVHLRHRGHGRDYWQAVGRVMPDHERRREDLRRCGVGLAW